MKRIQVQLPEVQSARLKELAKEKDKSVSELIREGVNWIIKKGISWETRKKKALKAIGKFSSSRKDVSEHHDKYITQSIP